MKENNNLLKSIDNYIQTPDTDTEKTKTYHSSLYKKFTIKVGVTTLILLIMASVVLFTENDVKKIMPALLPTIANYGLIVVFLSVVLCILLLLKIIYNKNVEGKETLKKMKSLYNAYDTIAFIVLVFYFLYMITFFLVTPANVSGDSMYPTFESGDKVFVSQVYKDIYRGDVMILDPEAYTYEDSAYIKRVFAIEGDIVELKSGYIYLNGENSNIPITQSDYIKMTSYKNEEYCDTTSETYKLIVPKNLYILIGDNRPISCDSRTFGMVHRNDLIGKVIYRFYPFSQIGKIDRRYQE